MKLSKSLLAILGFSILIGATAVAVTTGQLKGLGTILKIVPLPSSMVFPGTGPSFGRAVTIGNVVNSDPAHPYPDLIVGEPYHYKGHVYIFEGPAFDSEKAIDITPSLLGAGDFGQVIRVGKLHVTPLTDAPDFDDIVVGTPNCDIACNGPYLYVYLNQDWSYPWMSESLGSSWTKDIAIDDFNNDGVNDIVSMDTGRFAIAYGPIANKIKQGFKMDLQMNQFGGVHYSIASGDMNNDGFKDLVFGDLAVKGNILVRFGPDFLNYLQIPQPNPPAQGSGNFGEDLAVADVNNDGVQDIIVGAPWKDVSGITMAGEVMIFQGALNGNSVTYTPLYFLHAPAPTKKYEFGHSVAVGDANADGNVDILIGSPATLYIVSGPEPQGQSFWYYGPDFTRIEELKPLMPGITSYPKYFGYDLDAKDINGDGRSDAAIGAPAKGGHPNPPVDTLTWTHIYLMNQKPASNSSQPD